MNPEDIEAAAERGTRKAIEKDREEFYVNAEEHYKHHQFIEKAISFLDKTGSTVWGTLIRVVVITVISALVLGIVTLGGKQILAQLSREVLK